MEKSAKSDLLIVFATAGSLLAVAGIGITQSYITSALFLGVTAAEFGILSAVMFVLLVITYLIPTKKDR